MKELLGQIENYLDIDLTDEQSEKVKGIPEPGAKFSIKWKERTFVDKGYAFCLDGQSPDEFDICLHVTDVDNEDGHGEAPEEWIHLTYLLSNDDVQYIKFNKK